MDKYEEFNDSLEKKHNKCYEGEVADVDKACFAKHAHYADIAKHASTASHAEHAESATSACHADKAERACYSKIADHAKKADYACNTGNAENAGHANFADNARNADSAANAGYACNANHANNADQAANADHATNSDNATHAEIADKVNNIDTTKYFWISGGPNSSQVPANSTLLVQLLPTNVPAGNSIYVDRIRCSLGYYTPVPNGLHVRAFVSSLINISPLGDSATTTSNVVDEIPDTMLIYTNTTTEMTTVMICITIDNETTEILHTDMPDSWWVGIKIM